jgi:hypothetical protein
VADEKTTVTELVTGLGASGVESLEQALATPPRCLLGVGAQAWDQLRRAREGERHGALFTAAWDNGRAFYEARDGLRRRRPITIEWKGPHKPPGYDSLPADLRIDHVFLVSCKYGSDISANCSPSNLFDRLLSDRSHGAEPWYGTVAPEAYAAFYAAVRGVVAELPGDPASLEVHDIARIRQACIRQWPPELVEPWRSFSYDVAAASADRWDARLDTRAKRELMLWRLLRLETSPYFVLGMSKVGTPLRYRVATPWDWRQAFRLMSFSIAPVAAGQPLVKWEALVHDRLADVERTVSGQIEVRWSHGRFSAVEAKLHLTTAPHDVPGYFPLASGPRRRREPPLRLPGFSE